jgi:hypothetical protein
MLEDGQFIYVEWLFFPKDPQLTYWTNEFEELRQQRRSFITKMAISKYLGQASSHFARKGKKPKGNYRKNPLDEVIRLLFEAERLLNGLVSFFFTQS